MAPFWSVIAAIRARQQYAERLEAIDARKNASFDDWLERPLAEPPTVPDWDAFERRVERELRDVLRPTTDVVLPYRPPPVVLRMRPGRAAELAVPAQPGYAGVRSHRGVEGRVAPHVSGPHQPRCPAADLPRSIRHVGARHSRPRQIHARWRDCDARRGRRPGPVYPPSVINPTPGARMTDPITVSTDVVYGELGGALVLIPRDRADELASVRLAVKESATWGELRARLSGERLTEIAEAFDEEDQPADDVALADEPVPGWDDGDWPAWAAQEMLDWVPAEVQALGSGGSTRLSGEYLELAPEQADEVVGAMRAAGYTLERDDALIERASWG
jgi:hypothetical protein